MGWNYLSIPKLQRCNRWISNYFLKPFTRVNVLWETKISIIYTIPVHWHETSGWNRTSRKSRTWHFYIINTMGADDLATTGTRALATMVLTMLNRNNSFLARWGLINRTVTYGQLEVCLYVTVLIWHGIHLVRWNLRNHQYASSCLN